MLHRIVAIGGVLLAVALLLVSGVLVLAHRQIAKILPELPSTASILALPSSPDLPVRLSYINTASQGCPRSMVLEPSLDPDPDARFVMAHVAFVLEWADGRIFLIDTGMTRDDARRFGRPMEVLGANAIHPLGSVAEQLGAAAARVEGVAYTHLHPDHTSGTVSLCKHRRRALTVYQGPIQAESGNHTTRAGRRHLEAAGCTHQRVLSAGPLFVVPGFPGLGMIEGAGHTPGSQILVANVGTDGGTTTWIFAGDVANHIDGVRLDLPKPRLYSLLIVPENGKRLARLRMLLADLSSGRSGRRAKLLISHDQLQIEASGIATWTERGPLGRVRNR